MNIIEFFKKHHFYTPPCCAHCKYQKNSLPYAAWNGYDYCDHPDIQDVN